MTNTYLQGLKICNSEKAMGKWFSRHEFITMALVFIGVPIAMLATVAMCALAIILPMAAIMGWL